MDDFRLAIYNARLSQEKCASCGRVGTQTLYLKEFPEYLIGEVIEFREPIVVCKKCRHAIVLTEYKFEGEQTSKGTYV